jgi:hypothetical protein
MLLYERLLGDGWNELAPAVRLAHTTCKQLSLTGCFQITHGRGRLARCVAVMAGLPRESLSARTKLFVEPRGDKEVWHRAFDGVVLKTTQRAGRESLLVERFGAFEFRFALTVKEGGLFYRQVGVAFLIGPIPIMLWKKLAPHVAAHESPGTGWTTDVSVEISVPLIGRIMSYKGSLEQEHRNDTCRLASDSARSHRGF